MTGLCGRVTVGPTGITWVCIRTPHDLPRIPRSPHAFPRAAEADKHYMINPARKEPMTLIVVFTQDTLCDACGVPATITTDGTAANIEVDTGHGWPVDSDAAVVVRDGTHITTPCPQREHRHAAYCEGVLRFDLARHNGWALVEEVPHFVLPLVK